MAPTFYTNTAGKKVNTTGVTGQPLQRIQTLADNGKIMRARNVALRQRIKIPQAGAPAAQTPPQQAAPGTTQTLFPNARMFEPQNYEGSPLYKFQVSEGQKQLSKSLASRGLTNSGYGITQELDIPMRAAAQDTERMTNLGTANADRLASMQENESNRLENQSNNQWNRMYQAAGLMAQQSPWSAAIGGLNSSADYAAQGGEKQENFLRDYYQRAFAPPAQVAPVIAAPVARPDFANTGAVGNFGDYSAAQRWAEFIAGLLTPKATTTTGGA